MVDSRKKGIRGELAWRDWLHENLDLHARRGFGQSYGGSCRPDVETSINGLHFEVKCVESLNLHKAYVQALRDAKPGHIPIVVHKKIRQPWMITIKADDIFEFTEIIEKAKAKYDNDKNPQDKT